MKKVSMDVPEMEFNCMKLNERLPGEILKHWNIETVKWNGSVDLIEETGAFDLEIPFLDISYIPSAMRVIALSLQAKI